MRFSAVTALCAAPLALAGGLQAEVLPRGSSGVETSVNIGSGSMGSSKQSSHESSGSSLDVSISITEVILIWVNEGGNSATSTMKSMESMASQSGASATHNVIVGGSGLVYTPNTIEAAIGDMVVFTFMSNNHTASQSAFATPCDKLAGGFDSGFMPNVNNTVSPPPQMGMQVTVSTPIWFYCRQSGHCGKGMTFSINPTAAKTQAMFEQMAIAQKGAGTAGAITGGTAAAPPPPAAAPPPPPASMGSGSSSMSSSSGSYMSSGSGSSSSGGVCSCSCLCGVTAFPNAAVQGIGMYGGMSGSMPMSAMSS